MPLPAILLVLVVCSGTAAAQESGERAPGTDPGASTAPAGHAADSVEAAGDPSAPPTRPPSATRGAPTREQFLQHALGTQGDVRVPAALLSLVAMLAVVVVAWKKARRRGRPLGEDELDADDPDATGS